MGGQVSKENNVIEKVSLKESEETIQEELTWYKLYAAHFNLLLTGEDTLSKKSVPSEECLEILSDDEKPSQEDEIPNGSVLAVVDEVQTEESDAKTVQTEECNTETAQPECATEAVQSESNGENVVEYAQDMLAVNGILDETVELETPDGPDAWIYVSKDDKLSENVQQEASPIPEETSAIPEEEPTLVVQIVEVQVCNESSEATTENIGQSSSVESECSGVEADLCVDEEVTVQLLEDVEAIPNENLLEKMIEESDLLVEKLLECDPLGSDVHTECNDASSKVATTITIKLQQTKGVENDVNDMVTESGISGNLVDDDSDDGALEVPSVSQCISFYETKTKSTENLSNISPKKSPTSSPNKSPLKSDTCSIKSDTGSVKSEAGPIKSDISPTKSEDDNTYEADAGVNVSYSAVSLEIVMDDKVDDQISDIKIISSGTEIEVEPIDESETVKSVEETNEITEDQSVCPSEDVEVAAAVEVINEITEEQSLSSPPDVEIAADVKETNEIIEEQSVCPSADVEVTADVKVTNEIIEEHIVCPPVDVEVTADVEVTNEIAEEQSVCPPSEVEVTADVEVTNEIIEEHIVCPPADVEVTGDVGVTNKVTEEQSVCPPADVEATTDIEVRNEIAEEPSVCLPAEVEITADTEVTDEIIEEQSVCPPADVEVTADVKVTNEIIEEQSACPSMDVKVTADVEVTAEVEITKLKTEEQGVRLTTDIDIANSIEASTVDADIGEGECSTIDEILAKYAKTEETVVDEKEEICETVTELDIVLDRTSPSIDAGQLPDTEALPDTRDVSISDSDSIKSPLAEQSEEIKLAEEAFVKTNEFDEVVLPVGAKTFNVKMWTSPIRTTVDTSGDLGTNKTSSEGLVTNESDKETGETNESLNIPSIDNRLSYFEEKSTEDLTKEEDETFSHVLKISEKDGSQTIDVGCNDEIAFTTGEVDSSREIVISTKTEIVTEKDDDGSVKLIETKEVLTEEVDIVSESNDEKEVFVESLCEKEAIAVTLGEKEVIALSIGEKEVIAVSTGERHTSIGTDDGEISLDMQDMSIISTPDKANHTLEEFTHVEEGGEAEVEVMNAVDTTLENDSSITESEDGESVIECSVSTVIEVSTSHSTTDTSMERIEVDITATT